MMSVPSKLESSSIRASSPSLKGGRQSERAQQDREPWVSAVGSSNWPSNGSSSKGKGVAVPPSQSILDKLSELMPESEPSWA